MEDNSTTGILQAPEFAAVITHQPEKPFQASGSQHGTCGTRPSEAHLIVVAESHGSPADTDSYF